ncbi:MAG: prepilin-type cleavage/methylation domain-containing protein, partial [Verrucomicrobiales bacterium]|nr:prepilin-type cleavage/methylation domain-containing protein [Verrucomicrobiales bacterium]
KDLVDAKNPQVGAPEGTADVEFVVDVYFPATAPGVDEPLKGWAAHSKGRNRLWLDGHASWSRDARLR